MSILHKSEFDQALREIAHNALNLESENDRVRSYEWVKKLLHIKEEDDATSKIRNDYAQLLRINLKMGYLHGIFLKPPPAAKLAPLNEAVGKMVISEIKSLPQLGSLSSCISHKTSDGRAILSVKKIPGQGVMCYMAVSPRNPPK